MWKILIDFDSTIADSANCILKKIFNIDWKPEELQWDFKPYGTPELRSEMVRTFKTIEFWDALEPVPGFLDWLNTQQKEKIPIYICSKRPLDGLDLLIPWTRKHNIDKYIADYIFISKNYDKSLFIDDETIIIDDKPDCFWNSTSGHRILFGNYGYASAFLANHEGEYAHYPSDHVTSWDKMPFWRKTADGSVISYRKADR